MIVNKFIGLFRMSCLCTIHFFEFNLCNMTDNFNIRLDKIRFLLYSSE